MAILINRPILNKSLKRFGRFLKGLDYHPSTTVLLSPNRNIIKSHITQNDTLVFLSHGSEDKIYHKHDSVGSNCQILLDKSNIGLLKDKKVFSISCLTGIELGKEAISKDCKVYLGLNRYMEFEPSHKKISRMKKIGGKSTEKFKIERKDYYMRVLEERYKKVFYEVLDEAIIGKKSFKWVKLACEKRFARESQLNDINEELVEKAHLRFAQMSLRHLSQSFVLQGDPFEKFQ